VNDSLGTLRADFPGYTIDTEVRSGDDPTRYIAVRREPGPGPHTVITSDPAELRTELATGRSPAALTSSQPPSGYAAR
jgi:hypothetical protein